MLLRIRVSLLLVMVDQLLGVLKGRLEAHMPLRRDPAAEIPFLIFLRFLRFPVLISFLFLYLFVLC